MYKSLILLSRARESSLDLSRLFTQSLPSTGLSKKGPSAKKTCYFVIPSTKSEEEKYFDVI